MPFYNFKNNETEEITEELMSWSECEEYLKANPHLSLVILGAPSMGDPVRMGMKKADSGFRDLLKDIKKRNSRGRNKINAD